MAPLANLVGLTLIGGLSVQEAATTSAPADEVAAVRQVFMLGCLNVVERGWPLSSLADDLGLTTGDRSDIPGLADSEQIWNAPSPAGHVVVVEHGGTSRACSVFAFGVNAAVIRDDLNGWLSGEGAPFKKEGDAPTGSQTYRWERGEIDIGVVLSVNPTAKNAQAPAFAASMFLTN